MKNLVILHLESISRQCLAAFASSFPHTRRLLGEALVFDHFHSSATSTRMVITYLFHGNDFEYDTASRYQDMRPAGNNRNLFALLQSRGYRTEVLCLNGFHGIRTPLETLSDELPALWGTNDFPALFKRFDELTDAAPFAIYVWDLLTHIEHSRAVAPLSSGLTDQVQRACRLADDAVGVMLATLQRKGLLEDTTIVVYGDHGDDYWTHGYKAGMILDARLQGRHDPRHRALYRHHLGADGDSRCVRGGRAQRASRQHDRHRADLPGFAADR